MGSACGCHSFDPLTGKVRQCRLRWEKCPGLDFYTSADIRFYCSHQVTWIIKFFLDTDVDDRIVVVSFQWPTEDKEGSGYSLGVRIQSSVRRSAGFERPMQEIAEVHSRIARTGGDGVKLIQQIQRGRTWQDYSYDAKAALLYCCGVKTRRWDYYKWKSSWGLSIRSSRLTLDKSPQKHIEYG